MAEEGKFRIEKFDGTDFSWWRMQIEDLLVQKDLDVVLGDKPEKMSDADWAGLDRKAMSVIRLSLTKNVAFNILKEKTAKGIMDALSNILLSVGIKFDDEVQALLLLSSLPDTWSGTVTAVTSSAGPDGFTFEKIRDLVLGEDVRRRSSGESSEESLNIVRGRGNNRGSGSKNKRRSRSKTRDSSGVTCWKCKEVGHFRNQCPKEDKQVNIVRGSASDEDLFICCAESSVDSWVMDSGASFHATHSGEALQNLVVGDFGKVRLADDRALDVTSMGDIVLKTPVGFWTLKDVRVVPALKKSLISVRQLDEQGHEKKNEVRFTESCGQKKVFYARKKPRATGQTQDERARKGSMRPVRGICGSGSTGFASAKVLIRHWVWRTSIPAVETSPENFLLSMEIVCSQDVPGSGSACVQWEPVGTEDESKAVQAMTDGLKLRRVSTESSR
ncbi:unnamed protein product [Cuscuta campestris]|uniref:CCHC-type domain-containing protein n=1 Tax=Cuscuta campestris TaxID=132261 RepID=A0A484MWS8_9ASTE|nr:unnamed protein product [Cuscuta campestris]